MLEISKSANLSFKQINNSISVKNKQVDTKSIEIIIQGFTITGRVTSSEDNEGLPGVNVVVQGTSFGTVTDVNGNYSLEVPSSESVLVFSSVGYIKEEVAVGNRSVIDFNLMPDITALEEIVVVGYGTQVKRETTGSISSVSSEAVKSVPTATFTNSLQGRAAGVNIQETSGTPGASVNVKIRGINSISSGTNPLWVIDGIPVDQGGIGRSSNTVGQDIMSTINPSDIESIEILKDAAATVIYGSRGSNGVILVTTKRGTKGKGKGTVTFDYSTGVSDLTKDPDKLGFANTQQWFEIMDRAKAANGRSEYEPIETMGSPNFVTEISREEALSVNTNWFDEILRKGSFQDANIAYVQGLANGSVYASFNYRNDKSLNVGNDFERISGRINVDIEPVKNLNLGTKLNVMYTDNYRTKTNSGNAGSGSGFGAAIHQGLPWYPVYDETDPSGYWNPIANMKASTNRNLLYDRKQTYRALGGLYAEYSLPWVKGMAIRAEGSADIIQDNTVDWTSGLKSGSGLTSAYNGAYTRVTSNYNLLLKYNNNIAKYHNINFVAGMENYSKNTRKHEMDGQDLVGYNQEVGNSSPGIMGSMKAFYDDERYISSYFTRLNYTLKGKYLLGLSYRTDGSSAFSKSVRWGDFAAVSAGWIVSDEPFFTDLISVVSMAKIRASYGQTGNQDIETNKNITFYNNSEGNRYVSKDIIAAGTGISIGNETITWEVTNSFDVGFEFGLFDDRISGSMSYYMQNVSDLLLDVSTPPSAQIGTIKDNVGELINWGWEFDINATPISKGEFIWNFNFNFSTNQNEIVNLTDEMEQQKGSTLYVGGSLGTHKMAETVGIDSERGVFMIREIDRAVFDETGEYVFTGRNIPATHNNLGLHAMVLNNKTQYPTYYGGVNNNFSYKGFDLGILFSFSGGNYIYNTKQFQWASPLQGAYVKLADLLTDSWTGPGDKDAKYPLLYTEGQAPASTKWDTKADDPNFTDAEGNPMKGYWKYATLEAAEGKTDTETYERQELRRQTEYLEKGDYIRLKNLILGYNFSEKMAKRLGMSNLRVFVSGTNLLTLTKYTGFDPESGDAFNNLPPLRTYSGGLSITF
ncbi:MAG: SusC/RagA family TonB-linked outer membrane protein [Cyclobacteriaceae bacterium]|nr:SusC/RagA family TonB-linked outer membrane protein [Cyclobacteriaceae bacterium]